MTTNSAVLYLRSSKDRKDVSPSAQRRELQELARQRGLAIVGEFVDAVESGATEERPGFKRLQEAVLDPDRGWNTILMLDTARLSRRRIISMVFEEQTCKLAGVKVIYKTLPDSDPLSEMVLKSVMMAWDEYHSTVSKKKGLAGMAENVKAGFRAGGSAPRGYRLKRVGIGAVREGAEVTKSVLQPDPNTAPAMAAYLSARASGIPRKKAKAKAVITDVADNSLIGMEWNALTYAGHTVWNVHAERERGQYTGGAKRRPRDQWVIRRDTHPALITDAEAERIIAMLEAKAAARTERARDVRARQSPALLGGILFAPDGSKWWSEADRYRLKGGGVSKSIPRRKLDKAILDYVIADVTAPEFADSILDGTRKALAGRADRTELTKLTRKIADLERKAGRAMDLALEMADPSAALRKAEALEQQRAAAEREARDLEEAARQAEWIGTVTREDVARTLHRLVAEAKDEAGNAGKAFRESLIELVERIVLDPVTLHAVVTYRIAPTASGVKVASPRRPASNTRNWLKVEANHTLRTLLRHRE